MQTQTFKLSLKPDDHPPRVPAVFTNQYDVGRPFAAEIYDVDGSPYTFTDETVAVVGTKPSGTGFSYAATCSGNTVSFSTTGQMTVVHGFVRCGVVITKGNIVVGTLAFLLYVQQAPLTAETIIDSDDFGSIIDDAVFSYLETDGAANLNAAIDEWLDEHPEATTTVQDGSLTEAKFSSGLRKTAINPALAVCHTIAKIEKTEYNWRANFLSGALLSTYTGLQGACYNSIKGCFVLAITDADNNNAVLVEMGTDYTFGSVSSPLALGHANDMTFNASENKIYVACGNTGDNANKIVIINASDLTFDSAFTPDTTEYSVAWEIAYDENENLFYVAGGQSRLLVFDGTWNYLETRTLDLSGYSGDNRAVSQGADVYDGKFVILQMTQDSGGAYNSTFVVAFNDDGTVNSRLTLLNPAPGNEVESIVTINGIGYLIFGQSKLVVATLPLEAGKYIDAPNINSYIGGKAIESGANVDEFFNPGKYISLNTTISATLTGIPSTVVSGFELEVKNYTWAYIKQVLSTTTGYIYSRIYDSNNNAWSAWVLDRTPDDPAYPNRYIAGGYITNGGKQICFSVPVIGLPTAPTGVSSGGITIRQGGNYVLGSGSSTQSLLDTSVIDSLVFRLYSGNVTMIVNLKTAPANAINNDVASIFVDNLRFTF